MIARGLRRDEDAHAPQRRARDAPRVRSTRTATASCSPRAPRWWCWRSASTPAPAARASTASWSATARPPTRTTSPRPHPRARAPPAPCAWRWMRRGSGPSEIDYINAHGTSTQPNDRERDRGDQAGLRRARLQAAGLLDQVDDRAPARRGRGAGGHRLSAGHPRRLHPADHQLRRPPTPDCDLDYVPNTARARTITTALSNSMGFGGHNASLIFAKA